jgi:hypothetical protein
MLMRGFLACALLCKSRVILGLVIQPTFPKRDKQQQATRQTTKRARQSTSMFHSASRSQTKLIGGLI